jgi:uncharacterized protein YlxP (DUF503 family)
MTHLSTLTLQFHLEGCESLKDKRQRLSGLRERFGRQPHIAVSESDFADDLQRAEWTFVIIAASPQRIDQTINDIDEFAATQLDAVITERVKGLS